MAGNGPATAARQPELGTRTVERYLGRLEARNNPIDFMRALKIAVRWYCV